MTSLHALSSESSHPRYFVLALYNLFADASLRFREVLRPVMSSSDVAPEGFQSVGLPRTDGV
jgi:hypothetical protein